MNESSDLWDNRFRSHPWPTDPDPLLVGHVQGLPPGRALDMGSGPGRNSLWLASQGWTATAVDVSTVGLEMAAQRAREQGLALTTVQGDVHGWTPEEAAYELVVLANVHLNKNELPGALE